MAGGRSPLPLLFAAGLGEFSRLQCCLPSAPSHRSSCSLPGQLAILPPCPSPVFPPASPLPSPIPLHLFLPHSPSTCSSSRRTPSPWNAPSHTQLPASQSRIAKANPQASSQACTSGSSPWRNTPRSRRTRASPSCLPRTSRPRCPRRSRPQRRHRAQTSRSRSTRRAPRAPSTACRASELRLRVKLTGQEELSRRNWAAMVGGQQVSFEEDGRELTDRRWLRSERRTGR